MEHLHSYLTTFCSHLWANSTNLSVSLKIKRLIPTGHYQYAIGKVERYIRTAVEGTLYFVSKPKKYWDTYVQSPMYAYTPQSLITKETSLFNVILQRELPSAAIFGRLTRVASVTTTEIQSPHTSQRLLERVELMKTEVQNACQRNTRDMKRSTTWTLVLNQSYVLKLKYLSTAPNMPDSCPI